MFLFFRSLIILIIFTSQAWAIDRIYISKGVEKKTTIAINHFKNLSDKKSFHKTQTLQENIIKVISNDLTHCSLFKVVPSNAFIEERKGVNHTPHFISWKQVGAEILLNSEIKPINKFTFSVDFILWDVLMGQQIAHGSIKANIDSWRKVAHKISNQIYKAITGDAGYFETRVSYISEIKVKRASNTKRLAIMDYDGYNHYFLTDGKDIVLTPRLSPDLKYVLYVSYESKKPKVYIKSLITGNQTLIGAFPSMSFAPRFSPCGKKIVLSLANKGITDIFEVDLATKKVIQLTSNVGINTSPSYSPDGKLIYFNSDRSGGRHLYVMNVDGSDVQRISFGKGSYAIPSCSPNGKYISFTKIVPGEGFFIGVMKTDGSDEKLVANGYLVEGQTWAPNSRFLMFAKSIRTWPKKDITTKLYMVDVDGNNEQLIVTPNEASDPEWSN